MPLIDALMRELKDSGYISNRGRMIVSSYLMHDLKIDWRLGANYFEKMLIDHDVTSNYGGWTWQAGIHGGRVNKFNTLIQSNKFDPEGKYIKHWCPELSTVDTEFIHTPWNAPGVDKNA